jgi:hypothetical protein
MVDSLRVLGHLLPCERRRQARGAGATLHAVLAKDGLADQPSSSLRERIIYRVGHN